MILADADATQAVGAALAGAVRPGDVILLEGGLGVGKTSLARGLLAALGLSGEAPSPTFAIVQPYDPPDVRMRVIHVDLYRLEAGELEELGLDESAADAVLVVEWPDRAGAGAWPHALRLRLVAEGTGRRLTWEAPSAWAGRWPT